VNDLEELMHAPLTVIRVERPISQEEAEHIHDQFRRAVKDDRPVLVVDPETSITLLEPYRRASARAWFALLVSVLSLIIAAVGLVVVMAWT